MSSRNAARHSPERSCSIGRDECVVLEITPKRREKKKPPTPTDNPAGAAQKKLMHDNWQICALERVVLARCIKRGGKPCPGGRCAAGLRRPTKSRRTVARTTIAQRHGGRGDSTQLAQERSARDLVIRATAIEGHDGCRRVEVDSGTEHSRERVGPSTSLQSELLWPGRLVERLGEHACETAWHEAPEGVASGNAADAASIRQPACGAQ